MSMILTVLAVLALLTAAILAGFHLQTRRLTKQGAELVPQIGKVQPVAGGAIHYVEAGDPERQTLVLIHGLSGQLQHYTYALMPELSRDFHVLALDRSGCGYSVRDSAELGALTEQARMIREFLDAQGVTNPVLVGHSLGGAVALAMALDCPHKTAALALLSPLTHPTPGTPPAFKALEIRTGWLRNLIGHTLAVPMARKTAPQVLKAVFAPEPIPTDFLERAGGALGLRPSAFITASQDVVAANAGIGPLAARYPQLAVGGAILFGAEDPIVSPASQGLPMRAYGLEVEQLAGRGHMIPITAPDDCAAFIRKVAATTRQPKIPAV
ncbi:alpha/beta fold hydrolase [Ruegeria sediminis]|uniref:Alpha/beta fold hydrolase n=1 Tax=Ruegeria sediminis TaxID=2583820 RepID=A0ABY2WXE9_9RHOB|nr:alpha/beta fold hydrolase [Ruegeria sediminis]TMV07545.1 alpha/beta fold hydrolase [Ruegeria sediminis]